MGVLDGRTAIVTGGARGIGAAVSRRFAQEGAAVCVTDLFLEKAQAVVDVYAGTEFQAHTITERPEGMGDAEYRLAQEAAHRLQELLSVDDALALVAALSRTADFSVGCYCEDETRCHRSLLRRLLVQHGGKVA